MNPTAERMLLELIALGQDSRVPQVRAMVSLAQGALEADSHRSRKAINQAHYRQRKKERNGNGAGHVLPNSDHSNGHETGTRVAIGGRGQNEKTLSRSSHLSDSSPVLAEDLDPKQPDSKTSTSAERSDDRASGQLEVQESRAETESIVRRDPPRLPATMTQDDYERRKADQLQALAEWDGVGGRS